MNEYKRQHIFSVLYCYTHQCKAFYFILNSLQANMIKVLSLNVVSKPAVYVPYDLISFLVSNYPVANSFTKRISHPRAMNR